MPAIRARYVSATPAPLFVSIFGLISLALIVAGLWVGNQSWSFRRAAESVSGEVVGYEYSSSTSRGRSRTTAHSVIRYEVRGEPYELVTGVSSSPPAHDIGERVTVLYQAGKPETARVDSFLEFWFVTSILLGLGVAFMIPAAVFAVIWLRQSRR